MEINNPQSPDDDIINPLQEHNTSELNNVPNDKVLDSKTNFKLYFLLSLILLAVISIIGLYSQVFNRPPEVEKSQETNSQMESTKPSDVIEIEDSFKKEIIEPNLQSTSGWKMASLNVNVLVDQDGSTKPGKAVMMIPSDWNDEIIQVNPRNSSDSFCNALKLSNPTSEITLVIKPNCADSTNDYLKINGKIQVVEMNTKVGNDGHDSYIVRYPDDKKNNYHYGSIGVSPGSKIDIELDQIYPYLVLTYEPDRYEQGVWTSYDLTYAGNKEDEQLQLSTADTIISTLKLID